MTLLEDFLNDTIDPAQFDHRAHVVVAFELLQTTSLDAAMITYTKHLKALTQRAGAPAKFSAPVTNHALRLIASRMIGPETDAQFFARNPDLLSAESFKPS